MIQKKLQGITLTDDYSNSLIRLKSKCIKKIEDMCIKLVDKFYTSWYTQPKEVFLSMLESEYFVDVFEQHKFVCTYLEEWTQP